MPPMPLAAAVKMRYPNPFPGKPSPLSISGLFLFAPCVQTKLDGMPFRSVLEEKFGAALYKRMDRAMKERAVTPELVDELLSAMPDNGNQLVEMLRAALAGMPRRQQIEIRGYLQTMPNKSTKLLAVRCEALYAKCALSDDHVLARNSIAGASGPFPDFREDGTAPETAARIDAARAMEHRQEFFENQFGKDKELFEYLIGYVWKTEQSKSGVIHHHILFIFDGQDVRDEFVAFEGISRRWAAITKGAGYVNSSHFEKREFRKGGKWRYGMIGSPEALEAMIEDVATYFTKDEQPLRFKPTSHARTLVKGHPWQKREGGPGRPRKVFI